MVRPRIQLERLSGEFSRDHYYLHNKSIVCKKVKEMSVLTGADVLFLGFSPNGVPTLHLGENSNFMTIVKRFSEISEVDREKRRHDNIQTMKANYQKEQGYNIEVEKIFDAWKMSKVEELREEIRTIQKDIYDLRQTKWFFDHPEKVTSIEKLKEMEASLKESLEYVRKRKEEIRLEKQRIDAERIIESTLEPFENYLPEMLSGNDELLGFNTEVLSEYGASTSQNQQK